MCSDPLPVKTVIYTMSLLVWSQNDLEKRKGA